MKQLKCSDKYIEQIIEYNQTTTWRLYDDKDLQKDDLVSLVRVSDSKEFAGVMITDIEENKDIERMYGNWQGTESLREVIELFRSYYPNQQVEKDTKVKVINFKIIYESS